MPGGIGPLELVTPPLQPGLEFLAQHQRQERAEDVAPDRLVAPVEDRTGLQQRLTRPEPLLHHPEPLVLQRHLGGVQVGVRPQHPLAVVAGILGDLRLIDRKAGGVATAEVAAVALVADQRCSRSAATIAPRSAASLRASSSLKQTMYRRPSTHTSLTFKGEGSSPRARGGWTTR